MDSFLVNVKILKKPEELFTIFQGAREPLRKYVERFNSKYVNIPNYLESIVVLTFRMGLLQGLEFKEDLITRPPFNLEKVMSTSRGYIKLKEEEAQFATTRNRRQDEKNNDERFIRDISNHRSIKRFWNKEGLKFIKSLQSIPSNQSKLVMLVLISSTFQILN